MKAFPTRPLPYRPELDALRFFAFFSVFWFHRAVYCSADPARHPWQFRFGVIGVFGVPVFFLLSAYLISDLLLRERENSGRIRIAAFYQRRALRIWPLYFFALFGLAWLNRQIPGVGSNQPRLWLAFSGFAGDWYIVHHGWIAAPLDPLWSISAEEQFYLLVPLVIAAGGPRLLLVFSGLLLGVACLTILLYPLHPDWNPKGEWPNSFFQSQFFAAGCLLALWLRGRVVFLPFAYRIAGFVLGVDCWLVAVDRFHIGLLDPHPTPLAALAGWSLVVTGTVLFFLSALGTSSDLVPAWLAYLGRISYGLYLVHSLVLMLLFSQLAPVSGRLLLLGKHKWLADGLTTLLALSVSIVVAHLSYRYFERPLQKLRNAGASPIRPERAQAPNKCT